MIPCRFLCVFVFVFFCVCAARMALHCTALRKLHCTPLSYTQVDWLNIGAVVRAFHAFLKGHSQARSNATTLSEHITRSFEYLRFVSTMCGKHLAKIPLPSRLVDPTTAIKYCESLSPSSRLKFSRMNVLLVKWVFFFFFFQQVFHKIKF